MVREQILGRGVDNPRLLEAFLWTRRHLFVDEALSERAYGDAPLPIGSGQTISQPYIIARMLGLLDIRAGQKILEVGTGSGYQAAILWRLGARVFTMERLPALARRARHNWARAGAGPIRQRIGDGTLGWPSEAPFCAILVSAAVPAVPESLLAQLVQGGRMVIPVGSAVRQSLRRLRRTEGGAAVEEFDPCSFVRLIGREGFDE
jgi:protein-L-isoaspartate(D-aspartate) O-methyltransferase